VNVTREPLFDQLFESTAGFSFVPGRRCFAEIHAEGDIDAVGLQPSEVAIDRVLMHLTHELDCVGVVAGLVRTLRGEHDVHRHADDQIIGLKEATSNFLAIRHISQSR